MPMGLVNAMAIWSRFIDTAMAGMNDFVLCYADDVLVFTKSSRVEDHITDLERVFKELEKRGIKIKASKLKLGLKLMPFLGVVITREGMIPDKEKTAAIEKIQYPQNLKELRSILGMFAYYRRFIPKFSEIAAPLFVQTRKSVKNPRNSKGIILSDESKAAFDFLKKAITKEPIMLHYPVWDAPFEIHTDASGKAVAAILCQNIEGKERVLMYASKTLSPAEEKYHIYEKEALAVVWAAEVFRKYIRNNRTVVRTDCQALQWLKSRSEGRMVRWVVKLAEFDLDIQHRKGKNSANVDGITRTPPPENNTYGKVDVECLYDTREAVVAVTTRKRAYEKSSTDDSKKGEKADRRGKEKATEVKEKETEKREITAEDTHVEEKTTEASKEERKTKKKKKREREKEKKKSRERKKKKRREKEKEQKERRRERKKKKRRERKKKKQKRKRERKKKKKSERKKERRRKSQRKKEEKRERERRKKKKRERKKEEEKKRERKKEEEKRERKKEKKRERLPRRKRERQRPKNNSNTTATTPLPPQHHCHHNTTATTTPLPLPQQQQHHCHNNSNTTATTSLPQQHHCHTTATTPQQLHQQLHQQHHSNTSNTTSNTIATTLSHQQA